MTVLIKPGVYVECRRCEEMVLLNDVDNRCVCSTCGYMDKHKKDIVLGKLKDRKRWNKAYRDWMKRKQNI
jgi:hypothetical protein